MAPSGIDAIVAKAQARFGAIDGWVNNAGSAHPDDVGPIFGIDEGQWDRVVDLNLKWTFFDMQAAARAMAARGGSVVKLSSGSGSQPCSPPAPYVAAKPGVDSMSATATAQWGQSR